MPTIIDILELAGWIGAVAVIGGAGVFPRKSAIISILYKGLTARNVGDSVLLCNGSGYPVLYCGANYNNANANRGVFYMNSNNVGNSNANLGARLLRTTLTSNA